MRRRRSYWGRLSTTIWFVGRPCPGGSHFLLNCHIRLNGLRDGQSRVGSRVDSIISSYLFINQYYIQDSVSISSCVSVNLYPQTSLYYRSSLPISRPIAAIQAQCYIGSQSTS